MNVHVPAFSPPSRDALAWLGTRPIPTKPYSNTMSIDAGEAMPTFPVHQAWLRSGRWALEGLTNLDRAPAAGGLLFAGVAPLENATGMPARVIALFWTVARHPP